MFPAFDFSLMYNAVIYRMRFEVPQFIEVEDKIFGPFTWRQFVYLAGGFGAAVVAYLFLPFFLFILIGLPIGGLAVLLAFYPVNNRPFILFLESAVQFYKRHRLYRWRKKSEMVYQSREAVESTSTVIQSASPAPKPMQKPSGSISSLSRRLELQALQKKQ